MCVLHIARFECNIQLTKLSNHNKIIQFFVKK